MNEVQITYEEIVEELNKKIIELVQTNAILNIKCNKLTKELEKFDEKSKD